MTPKPDTASFSQPLVDYCAPLMDRDEVHDWALRTYLIGLGEAYQEVDDLVRDRAEYPGWAVLFDIDNCPVKALPWLAQIVGVALAPGLTEAQMRTAIINTANWKRGRFESMVGAVLPYLTGSQTVIFRERYNPSNPSVDSPYWLTVRTYVSETPDSAAAAAALQSSKPAGIILDYTTLPGQDWQQVVTDFASWQLVSNTYTTWENVAADQP